MYSNNIAAKYGINAPVLNLHRHLPSYFINQHQFTAKLPSFINNEQWKYKSAIDLIPSFQSLGITDISTLVNDRIFLELDSSRVLGLVDDKVFSVGFAGMELYDKLFPSISNKLTSIFSTYGVDSLEDLIDEISDKDYEEYANLEDTIISDPNLVESNFVGLTQEMAYSFVLNNFGIDLSKLNLPSKNKIMAIVYAAVIAALFATVWNVTGTLVSKTTETLFFPDSSDEILEVNKQQLEEQKRHNTVSESNQQREIQIKEEILEELKKLNTNSNKD